MIRQTVTLHTFISQLLFALTGGGGGPYTACLVLLAVVVWGLSAVYNQFCHVGSWTSALLQRGCEDWLKYELRMVKQRSWTKSRLLRTSWSIKFRERHSDRWVYAFTALPSNAAKCNMNNAALFTLCVYGCCPCGVLFVHLSDYWCLVLLLRWQLFEPAAVSIAPF